MADGRRRLGRILVMIAVVILVLVLVLNPTVQGILHGILGLGKSYPENATFELEKRYVIDANGGEVISFSVSFPMPTDILIDGHEIQQVLEVEAEPAWDRLENMYGAQWMVWEGGGLTGDDRLTISVSYKMTVSTFIWNIGKGSAGDIDQVPTSLRDMYLEDQWKMIVSHPDIQETAESIVGEEKNVYNILRAIYDWMTENIEYPSVLQAGEPKSSLETLYSGQGDCDDQAILFCSLARAVGVPAWLQLGVLYDRYQGSWGGHGWVEAYVPLGSGEGVNVTIDTANRDFMVWSPNRFVDFIDDGDEDHLESYYLSLHLTYNPLTYPPGERPLVQIAYEALDHTESQGRVTGEDFPVYHLSYCAVSVPAWLEDDPLT